MIEKETWDKNSKTIVIEKETQDKHSKTRTIQVQVHKTVLVRRQGHQQ